MSKPTPNTHTNKYLSPVSHDWSHHTIRHFIEAMRRHDPTLIEHGKRTAVFSLIIGSAMDLPANALFHLTHAALLHDLGKLTLPNEVICQNGVSFVGEYLMEECSPQAGAEILRAWPSLQSMGKIIALHHEHWDGSGNPFGMRGVFIPLESRILSLSDIIDQFLTQKEHTRPEQIDSLVRVLRALSGTRFDPKLVEISIKVLVPSIQQLNVHSPVDRTWSSEEFSMAWRKNHFAQGSHIDIHLKNILDLTNPIPYTPIPA